MASHLELELDKLRNTIIKITNLAENQVFEAMGILLSEPISQKKVIKKTEHKIDKLDTKIEEICQSVFALQQPVASDLRFIMSAMHISNEIERIGDFSINIIKLNKNISKKQNVIEKFNITYIARAIESIMIKTNVCFQTFDNKEIEEVFIINKDIKNKIEEAIQNIISEMTKKSELVVSGTNLIMILKHLERIGDHCTNIAESVYFVINAKTIRHENILSKK